VIFEFLKVSKDSWSYIQNSIDQNALEKIFENQNVVIERWNVITVKDMGLDGMSQGGDVEREKK
jgi:hypothetical protein